jgi:hypothetical protein
LMSASGALTVFDVPDPADVMEIVGRVATPIAESHEPS